MTFTAPIFSQLIPISRYGIDEADVVQAPSGVTGHGRIWPIASGGDLGAMGPRDKPEDDSGGYGGGGARRQLRVTCTRRGQQRSFLLAPRDRPSTAQMGNADAIGPTPSVALTEAQGQYRKLTRPVRRLKIGPLYEGQRPLLFR